MKAKKASKTQETVRIDSLQIQYLKYISALTRTPIAAIVREAVEDYLDIKYPGTVSTLEEKRGLLCTTTASDEPKQLHKAFDNMLRNLRALEQAKQRRHLAVKA